MNFSALRFKTLLLREWLQNRWTWLVVVGLVPALVLVTLPFGQVKLPDVNDDGTVLLPVVASAGIVLSALVCATFAWLTVLFMATGLARRDTQDRSIEFWLSLPSTHGEAIGAQFLAHTLLFPVGAMLAGLALGGVISPLVVLKWQGFGALASVGWLAAWGLALKMALLGLVTLLLVMVWMAPVVLGLMAASAWLKRLALPVLAIAAIFLANYSGTRAVVRGFAQSYAEHVGQLTEGLVRVFGGHLKQLRVDGVEMKMSAADYLSQAGANLASPQLALGLVVAALAAYLLVVKRRSA